MTASFEKGISQRVNGRVENQDRNFIVSSFYCEEDSDRKLQRRYIPSEIRNTLITRPIIITANRS